MKYYIITILIFLEAFWPIFNKVKKWISHCIFKFCAEGIVSFFQARKLIFCQMACINLLSLNSRGGPQSLDVVITTYSYPLLKKQRLQLTVLSNSAYFRICLWLSDFHYCVNLFIVIWMLWHSWKESKLNLSGVVNKQQEA